MEGDETRHLVFVHGQKGGTGKSTVASLLIELAPAPPMVVECDDSIPDVARRYAASGCAGISVPLVSAERPDDTLVDLLSEVEQVDERVIVVNLPGSAGFVVDEHAREIREVADACHRQLSVAYLLGAGEDSVRSALASAQNGLVAFSHRRVAVVNEYFGRSARSAWGPEVRSRWPGTEVVLPALTDRVAEKVRRIDLPYFDIAAGGREALAVIERSMLRRWLDRCRPIAEQIYA